MAHPSTPFAGFSRGLQWFEFVLVYGNWVLNENSFPFLFHGILQKLNDMWAGLGYYRRARFLLEGAKMIVAAGGDEYPNTLSSLRKVPRIGDYTAGAITSIAFKHVICFYKNDESSMVTDYPIEVVKANQRNDFSIVCVVEISASLDGSHQCKSDSRSLLIRRLDEGLLVDLWEFPLCYIG
ncbi:hypothetical protein V6N13_140443 [Hibiscus sabdariffa]